MIKNIIPTEFKELLLNNDFYANEIDIELFHNDMKFNSDDYRNMDYNNILRIYEVYNHCKNSKFKKNINKYNWMDYE